MGAGTHDSFQVREVFHLEFLRWLSRGLRAEDYAVKGGANLRFFFNSMRYSEDMDLDIRRIGVMPLQQSAMRILSSASFQDALRPFGIDRVVSPNIMKAKQTETTQRFKVHLATPAGEDLLTVVEFSRRGFAGIAVAEPVAERILRMYRLPPMVVSHYDVHSSVMQKIRALAGRSMIQARDIFDLYILSSQYRAPEPKHVQPDEAILAKARDKLFGVEFEQFRDTVLAYLAPEDRSPYSSPGQWDEIRLQAAKLIDELRG